MHVALAKPRWDVSFGTCRGKATILMAVSAQKVGIYGEHRASEEC